VKTKCIIEYASEIIRFVWEARIELMTVWEKIKVNTNRSQEETLVQWCGWHKICLQFNRGTFVWSSSTVCPIETALSYPYLRTCIASKHD